MFSGGQNNPNTPIRPVRTVVLNDPAASASQAPTPAPAQPASSQTQQTPQVCPVQPQSSFTPTPLPSAQTYQTPAQPGTIAYFEQQMPDVVAAWDQMSVAIDMQARLSGPGWERAPIPEADVRSAIQRLRTLVAEYQRLSVMFGANAPINYQYVAQHFTSEVNRLEGLLNRGQQVPGGLLEIQLNGREVHIFGDVHGNMQGLQTELNTPDASGRTLLQKIQANEAVVVFLGDLAHPTPDSGVPMTEMGSSVQVEDYVRGQLKTMYPDNVFDIPGNHGRYYGTGEEAIMRGNWSMGGMYRDQLVGQRRVGFARTAQEYADVSPRGVLIFEGNDLVVEAMHGMGVRNGVTREQIIRAALEYYVTDPLASMLGNPQLIRNRNAVADQMEWNRFDKNVSAADVEATRAGLGGTQRTVLVVAHTDGPNSAFQQTPGTVTLQFDDPTKPAHVIISADGSSVRAVGDVDPAIAGMNLREQIPQMRALGSQPTVPPTVPAQVPAAAVPAPAPATATAAPATSATSSTPSEAYVVTGTFQIRLTQGDSMPFDVSSDSVTLRCGTESFKISSYGDMVFIERAGTGQTWSMPQASTRANVNNLFDVTNNGQGKIEVRFTPPRSSNNNQPPPAAPAGGGTTATAPSGGSNPGTVYSWSLADPFGPQPVEENGWSVYGVSWGMPSEPAAVTVRAGYSADMCWSPALEPVAVGVGVGGTSEGVRLFDGYACYVGGDAWTAEAVSRPGSPTPPPSESAGAGTRAMETVRGFGAGFGVMTAINELLALAGIDQVPVIRHVAGAGTFLAGHAATVAATTEMTFAEAATNTASLREFWRSGGRFMALMPIVNDLLSRAGLTREALPDGPLGGALYQGANIGVTMLADATVTSTATTLGAYLEGVGLRGATTAASTALEAVSVYGWVLLGYQILSDMQSLIVPDAVGMEEDIRVAQMLSGVATCSTNGDESMRECTQDDWWEARHIIAGASPQYVSQLTAAEEQVHAQMDTEAVANANDLRTAFIAALAERLALDSIEYDGSTEPVTTEDRLASMLQDIIGAGLPERPMMPEYPTVCNGMDDDCDSNFDDQTDYAALPAYNEAVASYPESLAEYERVTANYDLLKGMITNEDNRGKNLAEIREMFVDQVAPREGISEAEASVQFDETLNIVMGEQFRKLAEARTPFGDETIFPVIQTALAEQGPGTEADIIAGYLLYQHVGETSIGLMSESMDAAADLAREIYMVDHENGMVDLVSDRWVVSPAYFPTADDIYDGRVLELSVDDPLYAMGYSYAVNTEYPAFQVLEKSPMLSSCV